MLHILFGNRNIERILLFLFINETCYGTQLHTLLNLPLTPIQHALAKLEKHGILTSSMEGKTKIYRFNSSCPFRWEIEALLKKAYTLLSAQEKKAYCFVHKPKKPLLIERQTEKERLKNLMLFWERLLKVRHLSLLTQSRSNQKKISQTGRAEITVVLESPSSVVFQEKGFWFVNDHPEVGFSNAFRWTLDRKAALITLEHLRYGAERPVFLFHLVPHSSHTLGSVDAHLCGEDTYLGNIVWNSDKLTFHWRIIGPRKNDELTYHYI